MKGWTVVIQDDCLYAVPLFVDTDIKNRFPDTGNDVEMDNESYEYYEMIFQDKEICVRAADCINNNWHKHRADIEKYYYLNFKENKVWTNEGLRIAFVNFIFGVLGCSKEKAFRNYELKHNQEI